MTREMAGSPVGVSGAAALPPKAPDVQILINTLLRRWLLILLLALLGMALGLVVGMKRAEQFSATTSGRARRSRWADLWRGLASTTPTVAPPLAGLRLAYNPSRSTVEPEIGGYLGDVGLHVGGRGWISRE